MSTDASQTPILSPVCWGYVHLPHHNSNNSRRRGLCGWVMGKLGKKEFRNHVTHTTYKHPDGGPLPHVPFVTKRNKYVPHVGKKQLAKLS